jgi:hypothetical protein
MTATQAEDQGENGSTGTGTRALGVGVFVMLRSKFSYPSKFP